MDYSVIKRKLESNRCSAHGGSPKITITSKGFTIDCCCEDFKKKLVHMSEKLVADAVADELKRAFR